MSKPEWGTKHTCQSCGAKYYDLNRSPVICPKCGTEFDPDALLRSRRIRTTTAKPEAPVAAAKPAKAADKAAAGTENEAELDEIDGEDKIESLVDEEGDEEDMIEDASELGEDEDDVADVVVEGDDAEDR